MHGGHAHGQAWLEQAIRAGIKLLTWRRHLGQVELLKTHVIDAVEDSCIISYRCWALQQVASHGFWTRSLAGHAIMAALRPGGTLRRGALKAPLQAAC